MSRRMALGIAKRASINMRLTEETKRLLDEAAERAGRSLGHEAELRIIRSFSDSDLATLIREQMAAILEPAIERAVEQALAKAPEAISEPIGSPPPAYRQ